MPTVVNGRLDTTLLVSVGGGQSLRADAAAAWLAVVAEVRARFGITLRLTDSYRPYSVQVRIFNERYDPASSGSGPFGDVRWWGGVRFVRMRGASAAVPGTSVHGWGLAIDVTGLGGFSGSAYAHLAAVAPAHGWTNTVGHTINEAWHWEYTPATDTAPAQEDDMFNDADRALLVEAVVTARRLEIKAKRADLRFLYGVTPDGLPFVALPQEGEWMIAPSVEVRDQHRWLMAQLGLVVEGTSAKDWDDVRVKTLGLAENGDVIADPEGLGDLREWKSYPGGKFPARA